ncbi:unnamed protein product [Musa acuminata subsp. malaccensis]|nr:unnamed protein product [Musa acuminata subsp. malaccensis]
MIIDYSAIRESGATINHWSLLRRILKRKTYIYSRGNRGGGW